MSDQPVAQPPPRHHDNPTLPHREMKGKSRWDIMSESLMKRGTAVADWAAGYMNYGVQCASSMHPRN